MTASAPETGAPDRGQYAGRVAVLATKHGKLPLVADPLGRIGLWVRAVHVDTDLLGTFSGEVPRPAPPLETAVLKARMGMAATGSALGLASEGSFGPHPDAPWVTVARELVVLVDGDRRLVVAGTATSTDVIAASVTAGPGSDLERLLPLADLPAHAVIVQPNEGPPAPVHKGLRSSGEIAAAMVECAARSADGAARIQTDLRAHCNPSRRAVIVRAAEDLARRLSATCPSCASAGWGPVDVVRGLPCSWCSAPVPLVRAEVDACPSCSHRAERRTVPEDAVASPAQCPYCNP